ncbi:hypothetical protein CDAR_312881 [Caerostris darwini]|uniref:Uncharacterized protein n=1 Tax=Caerostris darwini TaxID=1538125 RepID=A0AAV4MT09_9ARAC|nr:hypothetical protein CDAR_312881 [Caerostris darwini]
MHPGKINVYLQAPLYPFFFTFGSVKIPSDREKAIKTNGSSARSHLTNYGNDYLYEDTRLALVKVDFFTHKILIAPSYLGGMALRSSSENDVALERSIAQSPIFRAEGIGTVYY